MTWTTRLGVSLLAMTGAACGGTLKYDLRGSDVSPGADVQVAANVDVQRNMTRVDVKAAHMTPAERVLDGGTTWVAWARRDSSLPWVRLGALELADEGRAGKAQLTVSEVSFDFEVSAETNATVASPSDKTLFMQRIDGQ